MEYHAYSLPGSWTRIPGGLIQMDSGYSRAVWGVNKKYRAYKLKRDRKGWMLIGGLLRHVTAGEGGVWGVSSQFRVLYRWGKSQQSCDILYVRLANPLLYIRLPLLLNTAL